jgi:hypothetical protein
MSVLAVLAFAFVGVVGTLLIIIVVVFVIDRLQTGDAIRGNYPVLGRFRHLSSQVGEFSPVFLCDGSRGTAIQSRATLVGQARQ